MFQTSSESIAQRTNTYKQTSPFSKFFYLCLHRKFADSVRYLWDFWAGSASVTLTRDPQQPLPLHRPREYFDNDRGSSEGQSSSDRDVNKSSDERIRIEHCTRDWKKGRGRVQQGEKFKRNEPKELLVIKNERRTTNWIWINACLFYSDAIHSTTGSYLPSGLVESNVHTINDPSRRQTQLGVTNFYGSNPVSTALEILITVPVLVQKGV